MIGIEYNGPILVDKRDLALLINIHVYDLEDSNNIYRRQMSVGEERLQKKN